MQVKCYHGSWLQPVKWIQPTFGSQLEDEQPESLMESFQLTTLRGTDTGS